MQQAFRQLDLPSGEELRYYEVPPVPEPEVNFNGDICLRTRLYTTRRDDVVVAGWTMSVMFTVNRLAKDTWPFVKDFNPWQNEYGHYYTGVIGDLEGKKFRIGKKPNDPSSYSQFEYQVPKVIPEQLIVISQPVPEDGRNGGVSPGFHVFQLNEYGGKTIVTVLMDHASGTRGVTAEQALEPWLKFAPEAQRKWRDVFIPALKKLIYEAPSDAAR